MKAPWLTKAKVKKGTLLGGKYLGKSVICGKTWGKKLCQGIQEVLAGQKWLAGPALATPGLG